MNKSNKPFFFSKKELEECSDETYNKLKVYLPRCKKEIALNMGKDDWGVRYISYGDEDEISELINMILEWKYIAEKQKVLA